MEWDTAPYSNVCTNAPLAEAYKANAAAHLGKRFLTPAQEFAIPGGSTDMGNVSHCVPSIHAMFRIATEFGNHHEGFTAACGAEAAHAEARLAGKAMAMTALDLLREPELVQAAKRQFEADHPAGPEVL